MIKLSWLALLLLCVNSCYVFGLVYTVSDRFLRHFIMFRSKCKQQRSWSCAHVKSEVRRTKCNTELFTLVSECGKSRATQPVPLRTAERRTVVNLLHKRQ